MAKQFHYDLVIQCVDAIMTVIARGVRRGMSRDELLLLKARIDHEIDWRLLESEMMARLVVISDEPDGEKH